MTTRSIYCVALLVGSLLAACEKTEETPDGLWAPIQITVNGNACKSRTCMVPDSGGKYNITSSNYGSLWLNVIKENGEMVWPKDGDWSDYRDIHMVGEWYEVEYDEDGNLVANIMQKNVGSPSRTLTFDVECGDAFGSISLLQE